MDSKAFIFGVATEGETFTDREKETARLLKNFQHGVSTILISPRRWGKTSLVKKVQRLAQTENLLVVFLDVFSCRTEEEFLSMFASAVLKQTSSKVEEIVEHAKTFLSRIAPKIRFSPDPMTDFTLSVGWQHEDKNWQEILELPEQIAQKKGVRIVVCIDEFQQVAEFQNSITFQKKLRSVWQHHSAISYCLFGSKQHLMNELFEKKSYPFYKFGDAIYLQKISTPDWIKYICGRFEVTGKKISEDLAIRICETVDNHSSYVQQLSWILWTYTDLVATEKEFIAACQDLIDQNSVLFEKQIEGLSASQLNFLRALAAGIQSEFSKQEYLQRYKLGSSANVSIIKKALIKKEIIEVDHKEVRIADPVMKVWLQQLFSA